MQHGNRAAQDSNLTSITLLGLVEASWNVVAPAQKPDFVFRRNGWVHLNRRGRQFSRLLAAEVCASALVMLDTPCSEVVWRVLATHSIRQFPLHFPSRVSSCANTFQLQSTSNLELQRFTTLTILWTLFYLTTVTSHFPSTRLTYKYLDV